MVDLLYLIKLNTYESNQSFRFHWKQSFSLNIFGYKVIFMKNVIPLCVLRVLAGRIDQRGHY